jgi:hypothetical protein
MIGDNENVAKNAVAEARINGSFNRNKTKALLSTKKTRLKMRIIYFQSLNDTSLNKKAKNDCLASCGFLLTKKIHFFVYSVLYLAYENTCC